MNPEADDSPQRDGSGCRRLVLELAGDLAICELDGFVPCGKRENYAGFLRASGEQPPDKPTGESPERARIRFFDRPIGDDLRDAGPTLFASDSWSIAAAAGGQLVAGGYTMPAQPLWQALTDTEWGDIRVFSTGHPAFDRSGTFIHALRVLSRGVLMHRLLPRAAALLVHSAGVEVDGRAMILAGVSGAGKSTISKQLLGRNGTRVFNDDRVLLRETASGWVGYGTPWHGELGIAQNLKSPLAAVCLLAKSRESRAERLSPREALHGLLPMLSIPWYDERLASLGLRWCERLLESISVYRLHFRPDESAALAVERLARSLG